MNTIDISFDQHSIDMLKMTIGKITQDKNNYKNNLRSVFFGFGFKDLMVI